MFFCLGYVYKTHTYTHITHPKRINIQSNKLAWIWAVQRLNPKLKFNFHHLGLPVSVGNMSGENDQYEAQENGDTQQSWPDWIAHFLPLAGNWAIFGWAGICQHTLMYLMFEVYEEISIFHAHICIEFDVLLTNSSKCGHIWPLPPVFSRLNAPSNSLIVPRHDSSILVTSSMVWW